jgi:hypothetical protein
LFVFHIGLAKTGTSTLQATMAANVEELQVRGITYPLINARTRQLAHHILPRTLKSKDGLDAPAWETLRGLRAQAHETTVLLSAEGFSDSDPHLVRRGVDGDEARVIVYLRNYPAWAVSSYAQKAKWGGIALPFDDYLKGSVDSRANRIADRLLAWAEVFGPDHVRIRSVEPENLVNGQIIDDFLSALGTSREGLEIPPNANETPDWRVVELLKERHARDAAEAGRHPDEMMPVRKKVFAAGLAAGQRLGWRERTEYLTREQRRGLAEQYLSDRQRLMAAIPDCRIADLAMNFDRERPFLPSPEAVSLADRRAFEAVLAEVMAEQTAAEAAQQAKQERIKAQQQSERGRTKTTKLDGRLFGSLRGVVRRVWS